MADDFDRELNAYLDSLTDQLVAPVTAAVHREAERLSEAQRVELRQLLEPLEETGALEASCRVLPGEDRLEAVVVAGGEETTGDIRDGSGVPFDHALAFEFGTSRQAARPFFYPTYRRMRSRMVENINAAAEEVLK